MKPGGFSCEARETQEQQIPVKMSKSPFHNPPALGPEEGQEKCAHTGDKKSWPLLRLWPENTRLFPTRRVTSTSTTLPPANPPAASSGWWCFPSSQLSPGPRNNSISSFVRRAAVAQGPKWLLPRTPAKGRRGPVALPGERRGAMALFSLRPPCSRGRWAKSCAAEKNVFS